MVLTQHEIDLLDMVIETGHMTPDQLMEEASVKSSHYTNVINDMLENETIELGDAIYMALRDNERHWDSVWQYALHRKRAETRDEAIC